jgi:hypothetical protein
MTPPFSNTLPDDADEPTALSPEKVHNAQLSHSSLRFSLRRAMAPPPLIWSLCGPVLGAGLIGVASTPALPGIAVLWAAFGFRGEGARR